MGDIRSKRYRVAMGSEMGSEEGKSGGREAEEEKAGRGFSLPGRDITQ